MEKTLIRICAANGEDPDQTAFSEAVRSGSMLFVQAFFSRQLVFVTLEHLPYVGANKQYKERGNFLNYIKDILIFWKFMTVLPNLM